LDVFTLRLVGVRTTVAAAVGVVGGSEADDDFGGDDESDDSVDDFGGDDESDDGVEDFGGDDDASADVDDVGDETGNGDADDSFLCNDDDCEDRGASVAVGNGAEVEEVEDRGTDVRFRRACARTSFQIFT
jgi:hypothetical protein